MTERVAVIGAGICGLSAAWTLASAGVTVEVISRGSGATEQSSGAWDDCSDPRARNPEDTSWMSELDFVTHESQPVVVASNVGVVRSAVAVNSAILRLSDFQQQIIGVLDVGRDDFDAHWLARSWSEQPWATATGTRFVPIELDGVFDSTETKWPLAAFCRILDQEERVRRAERALSALEPRLGDVRVLLGGPWLGTRPVGDFPVGRLLRRSVPWFEVLHGLEGPFGSRFVQLRASMLGKLGVEFHDEWVERLIERVDGVDVLVGRAPSDDEKTTFEGRRYDGVLLCRGGLLGGGVRLQSISLGKQEGWVPRDDLAVDVGNDDGAEAVSGQLAGWDPTADADGWLGGRDEFAVRRLGRVVHVQSGISGLASFGAAARAGQVMAKLWLKQEA